MAEPAVKDKLTREQLEEIEQAFAVFDKDGDGTISTRELKIVMQAMGQNPTEQELEEIVKEIDVDGNGLIDFDEFTVLMTNQMNQEQTEFKVREAFKVFDKENLGYINAVDLRHIMTTKGEKMTDDEVDEMLMDADLDGDGHIEYDEFVTMLMEK